MQHKMYLKKKPMNIEFLLGIEEHETHKEEEWFSF